MSKLLENSLAHFVVEMSQRSRVRRLRAADMDLLSLSAKPRILQLRSQQTDHRLSQEAISIS